MDTLLQDLRHALRMSRDQPAFTATAILTLVLGIGATTAVFSVVNTVLLKPLPYPQPDRLVSLLQKDNGVPVAIFATPAQFSHWRELTDIFEDVVAWRTVSFDYGRGDVPASVTAGAVSDGYFRTLGAQFAAGRGLAPDEHSAGAAAVVVVSHRFWLRQLGGDPDVVGTTLPLNGVPHTVVGVTSSEFDVGGLDVRGFGVPEAWVPLQVDADSSDFSVTLDAFARLRDGVTLRAAQERLEASGAAYRERYPADTNEWEFTALGLTGHGRGGSSADAARACGCRRARAARGMCERREPAARARCGTRPRGRHSRCARRRARPHRAPVADGEPRADGDRSEPSGSSPAWSACAGCSRAACSICRGSASRHCSASIGAF